MSNGQTDGAQSCHSWKLPWYAAGTLDASSILEVEAHLATCADCAEEVRTWTDLSGALDERTEVPHISWMELIAFESAQPPLAPERRAQVESHVAECSKCRSILDDLVGPADRPLVAERNPWKTAFVVAAACVLLAVVAGAALLRERSAVFKVEGGQRVLLEPAYRGTPRTPGDPDAAIRVHGRGPWCFTLLLADPAEAGDYRFRVEGGSRAGGLRAAGSVAVDADRVATLWLRGPLEPGRFRISLRPAAKDEAPYMFEFVAAP